MKGLGGCISTLPEEDLATTTSSLIADNMTCDSSSFQDFNQNYTNRAALRVTPKQEPGVILSDRYPDRAVQYYRVFEKVRTSSELRYPVHLVCQLEELDRRLRQLDEIATTSALLEINSKEETDEDFEDRRGVLVVKHEPKVIFSKQVKIETSKLPRWKPHITIDRRMVEAEDE